MSNGTDGYFQILRDQVPAQQLLARSIGLVGAFSLCRVQVFVDMITNALRPDCGGCQAVRVSHQSRLGVHVVDPTQQHFMAEVQIHLPMSAWPWGSTKPSCCSPVPRGSPREMLSQRMIWRRQISQLCGQGGS